MDKNDKPIVKDNYKNIDGKVFLGVREIEFTKEQLCTSLGKYITSTKYEENDFFSEEDNIDRGINLYQDKNDINKGFKIYKEFSNAFFNSNDDELIYKLLQKKKNIKLTEFPTGVVTLDKRIIGQEIVYYPNSNTVSYCAKSKNLDIKPYHLYSQILTIIEELYDNGIMYIDCHARNFLLIDEVIKLIDFEKYYIKFDDKWYTKSILENLKELINSINQFYKIPLFLPIENSFSEFNKYVLSLR